LSNTLDCFAWAGMEVCAADGRTFAQQEAEIANV
jgi:hypothetical protein